MRLYISENKENSTDQAQGGVEEVAAQRDLHEKQAKERKDGHGDHLLHDLELREREVLSAQAVTGNLEDVLKKSDAPTGENNHPQRFELKATLEMAIPGKSHEDV